MLLKNAKDIRMLLEIVHKCKGDVILRSLDGIEEFNLNSTLSQYIAINRLYDERGDQYEIYCTNKDDEVYMMQFFIRNRNN